MAITMFTVVHRAAHKNRSKPVHERVSVLTAAVYPFIQCTVLSHYFNSSTLFLIVLFFARNYDVFSIFLLLNIAVWLVKTLKCLHYNCTIRVVNKCSLLTVATTTSTRANTVDWPQPMIKRICSAGRPDDGWIRLDGPTRCALIEYRLIKDV